MDGWMDGWVGGWMGEWVDGCMDGWMDGSIDRQRFFFVSELEEGKFRSRTYHFAHDLH